jgi:hypothetical protein
MSLREAFHEWREECRLAAEAESLPDSEVAGLGLSRADFNDVARMTAARVARMEIMASLHGVTDAQLDANPETRLGVSLTCARCSHTRDCTRQLTRPERTAVRTTVEACGFCPNADTFAALAHDRCS